MKPSKALLAFLAAFAVSSIPLHAATIQLDLTSNNAGAISLDAGDNTFSFTGFNVDYLIVGGGGAGATTSSGTGTDAGGGGGAGGLLSGTTNIAGVSTIAVGAPGAVNTGNGGKGGDGGNSSAFDLTAIGGGGGGWAGVSPGSGGSGGGAGSRGSLGGDIGGSGEAGQGNNGGSRVVTGTRGGASGGGAGGAGNDNTSATTGATGGLGLSSSITGVATTYAAGGDGGSGGVAAPGAAASDNTGGGGAGGGGSGSQRGGAGGSGIVVVSYSGSQVLAGGIVSTVGGNTVHEFKTVGSSTLDLHSATIAGDISGDGNLVWDKTGTLTLSGNNTYTGGTTVSAGALIVTGSITSDFTVGDNATMGGGGTVGNISFASGSLFDMFKAVAEDDSLAASAISFAAEGFGIESLRYDGSAVNWASIASDTYTLITGTLDSTNLGNFGVGNAFEIGDGRHAFFQDGSLQLVVENIPEPSAALLGGLGLLVLLRRRR